MYCPRDLSLLVTENRQAVNLHACRSCRGLWISLEHLHRHFQSGARAVPVKMMSASKGVSLKVWCPQCRAPLVGKMMEGVEVDICHACKGIWLDAGELEAIVKWHRQRRAAKTNKRSRGAGLMDSVGDGLVDGAIDVAFDSDFVSEVASGVGNLLEKTPELAGEAAGALLEFLGAALDGIF
jgi:Zn-finger nucleic acid-binding protein